MTWLVAVSALAVAFANGANDNFKGVATLHGSRTTDHRRALVWATVTTACGSLVASLLAGSLLARFGGKGLVPDALTMDPAFLAAVGGGAAVTVLLASLLGAPISTTHALLGALSGAGALASGGALKLSALAGTFLGPLLVSPFLAVGMVAVAHAWMRSLPRASRETEAGTCVRATGIQMVTPRFESGSTRGFRVPLTVVGSARECVGHGLTPAIVPPRALDMAHYVSAGVVCFSRGVNDTPKLVALLVPLQAFHVTWGVPVVAAAMALGGILGSRRVARTMSHGITPMTPDQGLIANLVTAGLVLLASRLGLPVSTTHISAGALFGLGAVTRGLCRAVVDRIVFAWVATIPFAALCGGLLWLAIAPG